MDWQKVSLTVIARYGMSDTPEAYVIHEVNPDRTTAWIRHGFPGATTYYVNFYCRKRPRKVRLFTRIPKGFKVCKTCTMRKVHGPLTRSEEQSDQV